MSVAPTQRAEQPEEAQRGPRRRMAPAFFRGMRAAVLLLTRVPVGGFPYVDADWRWAAAHLPLVGSVLGACAAATFALVARAGSAVAAIVAVGFVIVVTGALHEDGLADSADALFGATTRERLFAILKDSRVGSFGACALVLTIAARVALVARIAGVDPHAGWRADWPWLLALVGAASRLSPVLLIASLPYVTESTVAKSRSVASAGAPEACVAAVWTLAIGAAAHAVGGASLGVVAASMATPVMVALCTGLYFRARAGGITGDFLGAAQQVAECAILLVVALLRGGAS